ncbi:MAG: HlyD family efflux transporter periplasmic adaptor subunit [Anaerolineae bacterium]|jgi:HlyD family secretion protein|nr:HlyD family efflux transporter periplasmic adaptor subunit [Anaerolineae bacterium]
MNTKKTLYILIIIFVLALSACGAEETPTPEPVETVSSNAVIAEGHIFPAQNVQLNFTVRGRVSEILVAEGEMVTKDKVIIRLADFEQAEASLRAAEFELITAQDTYDDFLRTGELSQAKAWQAYQNAQIIRAEAEREWESVDEDNLQDGIDDAESELRDRQEDLDDAQEEFDKYADLDEDNSKRDGAEKDLEDAQEDFNEAKRDLEEAIRDLDDARIELDAALGTEAEAKYFYETRVDGGLATDQKAFLESRLSTAKAQVAAAQNALDGYELKAPFEGTVTDIDVEVGQLVGAEKWVVQLADLSKFHVETSDLTELEVVKISEGQIVEIVPDALLDLLLQGRVTSISQSFQTQAGDVVYAVTIELVETDPNLMWGMTVEAVFLGE